MNIYQKLQQARVDLQNMKLKKSGKNQSMTYYELGDILPAVNVLCQKHDLFTKLNIIHDGVEKAILTIYNASEPTEKIDFVCPTAEAELPRGQKIQNLGAKITYLRRYMIMTAFEIVESDMVDAVNREMIEEVEEIDIKAIEETKSLDDLTKLFNELNKKYKVGMIKELFSAKKTRLEQDKDIKTIKKGK